MLPLRTREESPLSNGVGEKRNEMGRGGKGQRGRKKTKVPKTTEPASRRRRKVAKTAAVHHGQAGSSKNIPSGNHEKP